MVDSMRYKVWFDMALKDLRSAEILYNHDADLGIVCFHCQQAIEKYLKGYIIYNLGVLQEGHSLTKLCRKAYESDEEINLFIKDCAFVNTFYIETRYPAEDSLAVSKEDVTECMNIVHNIIKHIDERIAN